MKEFTVYPIGSIEGEEGAQFIQLAPGYAPALAGLEGFGHIDVLWWFDRCDTPAARALRIAGRPYTHGPAVMGVFATRSPQRPNPIALSVAQVLRIDQERGRIWIAYSDAEPGNLTGRANSTFNRGGKPCRRAGAGRAGHKTDPAGVPRKAAIQTKNSGFAGQDRCFFALF